MTFRDKSTSKFYAFALAAVFALTLAGCGGGGGGGAAGGGDDGMTTQDPAVAQRAAISTAIEAASTAVNAVDNDSTDAEVSAADMAIANARSAIAAAANVPAEEKAANTGTVDALATQLDGAKTARQMAIDEADMADKMAMMATAMKLYAGIYAPAAANTGTELGDVHAGYGTGDDAANIVVTIGDGTTANSETLSEDEDTTVAANHGWEGMRFTASPEGDGTYEAYVYSDVGDPTEGAKFNDAANGGYTLNADDQIADVTTVTNYAGLVASPSFDQSAGTKSFELPDNNVAVKIAGTFNGVAGTYSCTPTNADTNCMATVAASGFTLAGGTWVFEPNDPEARLMNVPDAIYASYGWWLHTAENGDLTASAFAADRGDVPDASGITTLRGTATYMGGAAGKYALRSLTGGTNDAGHFTAKATLEADFNADTITGTIDNFIGADGEARNWSVALNESTVSDTGAIAGDPETDGNTDAQQTVWTMGGSAASASGQWSGNLQDNGDDGVPQVGTGTFFSTFGADGNMVGAFGARKMME